MEIFTFTLDDKLFTVLVSVLDDVLLELICSDGSKDVCECLLVSDCFVDRNWLEEKIFCSCCVLMVVLLAGGMVVVVVVVLVDVVIT